MALSRRQVLLSGAGAVAAAAVASAPRVAQAAPSFEGWFNSTLAHMSLDQKIGQLMVQEVYGADPYAPDNRNMRQYGTRRPVDVPPDHLRRLVAHAMRPHLRNRPE